VQNVNASQGCQRCRSDGDDLVERQVRCYFHAPVGCASWTGAISERLEPLELLNCHYDHDWSTVLLDRNGRGLRKVNQTAKTILGVFRYHASRGAPDAAFGYNGQIGHFGNAGCGGSSKGLLADSAIVENRVFWQSWRRG